ncbi:hypothetical protein [Paraburkholderia diazotrophica]|uniref:Uncharacterized protein n=1 Tax=Paraburkholderia diazotrophica TaxID=667676 RepID=A0A1H6Z5K8_9BURK|nr:hypothetical protein [Paraburkholderia diazotrophica]SEJ44860.1 hypothetical protein SAMN05192539_101174 [Paraburkholderia diazotrophica]
MKFTRRNCAGVLSGLLALLCADPTVVAKHDRVWWPPQWQLAAGRVRVTPSSKSVLIERVNFVLDQEAQTKEEEAKKKRKAEQQHRAATAKPKPGPKAASAAAASIVQPTASQPQASSSSAAATRTEHGAQSTASEPTPAQGGASAAPAAKLAPASSAASSAAVASAAAPASPHGGNPGTSTNAATTAALNPAEPGNASRQGASQLSRLTREQLIPLMRGATILRTNTSGALRQWVNGPDGTLTVYWAGGGFLQSHSASGKWSVTEDGRFCLQIDWPDVPENWCRFMERTANGAYQPIPDSADATWTPPKDKTEWRPMTIRR